MKYINKNMIGILLIATVLVSCNSDLEKRVSSLEQRMVALENGTQAQSTSAPAAIQTASNPTNPQEKPDGPLPEFSFAETVYDFGQITEGDVVTHTFKFTNTGDAPLVIQNATATCGCTIPSYPKKPVPVGETGEIVVEFNSANKSGVQNKVITLTANTYPTTSKLNIKTVVAAKGESTNGPVK